MGNQDFPHRRFSVIIEEYYSGGNAIMFETDFMRIKQRAQKQQQYVDDVLLSGMERHLFHAEKEPIFEKILERNHLSITKSVGRTDSLHCLEHYDLSARSYIFLRRTGATTIEDVALMSEEDLRSIKHLAKRHVAEILTIIEENHIKENTDWDLYKIEKEREAQDDSVIYSDITLSSESVIKTYRFSWNTDPDLIAEQMASAFLTDLCGSRHLISRYSLSTGFLFLLLIKGYLFAETIVQNADEIRKDLIATGFDAYLDEFIDLLKAITNYHAEQI